VRDRQEKSFRISRKGTFVITPLVTVGETEVSFPDMPVGLKENPGDLF
jgi:hypothetical protein